MTPTRDQAPAADLEGRYSMQDTDPTWQTVNVADIRPGDHVRHGLREFDVARIQSPFLGQTALVCLIEDTPARWHAYPVGVTLAIEVRSRDE